MAQNAFRITKPGYSPTSDPLQDLAAITGYQPEGEDDSFAIDLERELMGAVDAPNGQRSLASELEAAFGAPVHDEPLPQPVNDDDFMASFADDISAGLVAGEALPAETGFAEAERVLQPKEAQYSETDFDAPEFSADAEIDLDFGDLDFSVEPVAEAAAQPDFASAQPDFEAELLAFATGAVAAARTAETRGVPAASAESPPFFDTFPDAAEPAAEMRDAAFDAPDFLDEAVTPEPQKDWHIENAATSAEDEEPVANWSAATHPQNVWQDEPAETTAAAPVAEPEVPEADPFAELARLAASYSATRTVFSRAPIWANRKAEQAPVQAAAPAPAEVEEYEPAHAEAETPVAAFGSAEADDGLARRDVGGLPTMNGPEALDFDIVELPEEQVALADDLDLPDVTWGDEPVAAAYDDYDNSYEPAYVPAARQAEVGEVIAEDPFGGNFEADFERELALEQGFSPVVPPMQSAKATPVQTASPAIAFDDFAAAAPARAAPPSGRKPMLIAAAVAGIALLGGIGVYAMSGRTSGTAAPAVIKADDAPVKVKPENPGGTKIGNQDSAVYEKVSGADAAAPSQEKLVTTAEEPVEIAKVLPAEQAALPEAKGEDRIIAEDQPDPAIAPETVAVQPKRVKTMVVKPDGSMVLREQPAAQAVEAIPAETAQTEAAKPAAEPEVTFTPPAAPEKPAVEVAAVEPEDPVAAKVAEPVDSVEAAIAEPVAPKPAKAVKKPVQKAKKPEAAAEQVALAEPEAAAPATGGGWSIQIASQPSKDGAQSSYKSLASKYGSIIGGKGVQIVPAQIEGKGTFYRVRIPAGSKEEAAALCARYKSAGGSCFPSR